MTRIFFFFFFNDTATTEIYTLSLHDALPISVVQEHRAREAVARVLLAEPEEKAGGAEQDSERGGEEDRKSTRLNSSHSQISYAVFCLKKKKNPNEICVVILAWWLSVVYRVTL